MSYNMNWKVFQRLYPELAANLCKAFPDVPCDPRYVFRVVNGMLEFGYPEDMWLLR